MGQLQMPKLRSSEFIWAHLALAGVDQDGLASRIRTKNRADPRLAKTEPGTNVKADNSEALIKVYGDQRWINALPSGLRGKIVRVYTATDHDEARAMVTDEEWTGERG